MENRIWFSNIFMGLRRLWRAKPSTVPDKKTCFEETVMGLGLAGMFMLLSFLIAALLRRQPGLLPALPKRILKRPVLLALSRGHGLPRLMHRGRSFSSSPAPARPIATATIRLA